MEKMGQAIIAHWVANQDALHKLLGGNLMAKNFFLDGNEIHVRVVVLNRFRN